MVTQIRFHIEESDVWKTGCSQITQVDLPLTKIPKLRIVISKVPNDYFGGLED